MNPMSGGKKLPVNDALLIPQIAAQLALGKSCMAIADNLNVGYHTAKRISKMDETKAIVKEIGDSYKEVAKAVAVKAISEMTELAVEGLKKALKEGNVQAVRTHFQVVGLLGQDDQALKDKGGGSLTVVLPGGSLTQENVIDVSNTEMEVGREPESDQDLQ
jgi:uncharacterized protein involved in tolerance to divalent cations